MFVASVETVSLVQRPRDNVFDYEFVVVKFEFDCRFAFVTSRLELLVSLRTRQSTMKSGKQTYFTTSRCR